MSDRKTVIALGYFDGVHKGHNAVLTIAKDRAERENSRAAVFTFGGNLRGTLSGGKCVFTAKERARLLKEKGFDEVFSAPVTEKFLSFSPERFLDFLNKKFRVSGYVCGEDYRFGKGGSGDVGFLKEYAEKRGQFVEVCPAVIIKGEKVSATLIKKRLSVGDVKGANELLSTDYFITGKVKRDRKVGRKLGFPTVNIYVDADKCELKNGVYVGYSVINGVKYTAIINYGSRPTFNLNEKLLEAHLIGFSGSLYGKKLRISFTRYLRDIFTFNNEEELKEQLRKDAENALRGENV